MLKCKQGTGNVGIWCHCNISGTSKARKCLGYNGAFITWIRNDAFISTTLSPQWKAAGFWCKNSSSLDYTAMQYRWRAVMDSSSQPDEKKKMQYSDRMTLCLTGGGHIQHFPGSKSCILAAEMNWKSSEKASKQRGAAKVTLPWQRWLAARWLAGALIYARSELCADLFVSF